MPDPTRLAVDPELVADAGRRLAALTGHLDRASAHLHGPAPAPPLGNAACAIAYQGAQHQLSGLITTALEQGRAIAGSLGIAARAYAALDRPATDAALTGSDTLIGAR
jgi:hypothetical protein